MKFYMSAETQNYEAELLNVMVDNQPNVKISNNRICNLRLIKGQAIKIKFRINYSDYCSMEVKTFGYSV